MRSRSANRSGIVIRRRVTPAGDIIVTLLTPQGKLKAIARGGVRGPLSSRLNLFHHVGVQIYQTPGNDLATVQQAVLEGALPSLAQPGRYAFAHLMAEFADALFQEGEFSEQAFELFAGALRGVAHQPDPEWVALVMSYKLLALAGFVPQTARCARCGAPAPAHPDPLGGQLLCARCAALPAYPAEALDFLQGVVRRTVRESMAHPLSAEQRPALWRALERFVTAQVGSVQSWRQLVPTALSA
ncbi:DNA repair protein RecO [Deinococcus arcticus]|uniref:DNA repair protein RecO n=1 Tax=Deinococcus arcticus TaxID=2136176 RepID=A0A2T3WBK2_9DEIO|nr:DNA repair protein RecO [Deinococcus arcticus]PTA69256.1 DNA repair protein RecO [Deinococcus arcticus]